MNVARTVNELKVSGAAAVQIEDQILPKRCGHLEGKELVAVEEMVKKILAAKETASGELFVVARTDARAVEGLDGAVDRALEYARAGADMIFPEALESGEEFVEFRRKVGGPLMANMTEFGRTPYMSVSEFQEIGYDVVIFPMTAFRAAMKAVRETLKELKLRGTQKNILGSLMSRSEFYDLISYDLYEKTDKRTAEAARKLLKRRR